ncbi:MAG: cation diffusion facilitator transporter [Ignavibacterium sp.]|uniref:cation diffusion facilitator family transporter n=1 Tax=Ignavibacterium sp. TaxID=2651167 RepID=UPI0021DC4BEB|nr:cation diffusion facilitator family transporter [Ignavibacterium sp.]BDQ02210.1 MAG: cation diffusion facilitator transporter [Ignavibacterium sp.]GIV45848.1 MAG: cation diffusion facilitator transporter [Ignavibacterium sp.]
MTQKEDNFSVNKRAAIISMAVGLLMFTAKISAYLITGSSAIFSDAAESVVHIFATGMALFSIIFSNKPADQSHFYGHGNVEYFSAGIEGFLIIVAAVVIIYESAKDLILGVELQKMDIGLYVITAAGIINLLLGLFLIRTGKKTGSLTLVADGKHVLTDSYTSIGVMVGIILVLFTGIKEIDPIFAIIVATNILFTGYKLIRQSIGGLMNETDEEILKKISDLLLSIRKDYWIDLHQLRFWTSGERVFIDFHLIVPFYFTVKQSHDEEDFIKSELQKIFPNVDLKIHFDYCWDDLCKLCSFEECPHRKEIFSEKFLWNKEKLIGGTIIPKAG